MGTVIVCVLLLIVAAAMAVFAGKKIGPQGDQIAIPTSLRLWAFVPFGFALLVFLFASVNVVPAGSEAVPVTFGSVGKPVGAGVHIVAPWTKLHTITVRTQQYTMVHQNGEGNVKGDDSISVLGSDAAAADVDATLLYHVDPAQAGTLYRRIGGDYVNTIVRPTSRTCIRNAFANVPIVDAATDQRSEVAASIKTCLVDEFSKRGLVLEDFQLRNVGLSSHLQDAVNAKVAANQAAQQKVFELQAAKGDAQIATVSAKATADSQQILACGGQNVKGVDSTGKPVIVVVPNDKDHCNQSQLTPAFLQYSYIQALKGLVNSPNNSTLILPTDSKLTPLLNTK
jgi:regulator of protease activity HflC (stomatin/prohibitin superfamily)